MIVNNIIEYLEARFPKTDAEDFDLPRIGFCVGNKNIEVKNIMLSLDLTMEVLDEAIAKECNMIITHHPFIWNPLYKFMFDDEKTKIIKKLLNNEISLYSMHTNLDVALGGVNDTLAEMLGIENIKSLNKDNISRKGDFLRYGEIQEITLKDLSENVKLAFGLNGVRVLGNLNKKIKKIGIIGGAGGGIAEINDAIYHNLDCYITGEVRLDCAQYACTQGLALIEVKHGIEKFVFTSLIEELRKAFKDLYNYNQDIFITTIETDKFTYL